MSTAQTPLLDFDAADEEAHRRMEAKGQSGGEGFAGWQEARDAAIEAQAQAANRKLFDDLAVEQYEHALTKQRAEAAEAKYDALRKERRDAVSILLNVKEVILDQMWDDEAARRKIDKMLFDSLDLVLRAAHQRLRDAVVEASSYITKLDDEDAIRGVSDAYDRLAAFEAQHPEVCNGNG